MLTICLSPRVLTLRAYLSQACLFFMVLTGFFIPISITGTDICLATTAALGVLSGRFFTDISDLKKNPLVISSLWIMALVLIALAWSIAPWSDRWSAVHKYSKLLYIPLLLPLCREVKWRDRTIYAFLFAMLITVVISYLKAWAGLRFGSFPLYPSFVFYTHIETGFLVAFATYLLAYYAWKQPKWRVVLWSLVLVFTYQEFFINDGRTGWLAYIVLLLLYAVHRIGWKGLFYGGVVAVVLISTCYYISPTFKNTFEESVESVNKYYKAGYVQTSLGYRLSFIKLSTNLIKEHPLLGYGTGSFATAYLDTKGIPGWKILRTPHNEYLMIMVEFGLLGLISLLLLFYYHFKMSFKINEMMYLGQALLLAFMASSWFNAFLYLSVSGHFFVFFTALFFSRYQDANAT